MKAREHPHKEKKNANLKSYPALRKPTPPSIVSMEAMVTL